MSTPIQQSEAATLKQFKPGSVMFGFVAGPKGYIVTENDFCHQVRALSENIELRIGMPWEATDEQSTFQTFTISEIREAAEPVSLLREWAHYWGIKTRIADNYRELLKSMREIGLDTKSMPKWGEDDRPGRVAA
jgi:hypothetical protein